MLYRIAVFTMLLVLSACDAKDYPAPGDLLTGIPPHSGPAQYPGGISATLIGGVPVDPNDPFVDAILKIRTDQSGCTASLIGPRVMITAAHCGKSDTSSVFEVQGKSYSTINERSPLYPAKDHDMMLGLVDKPVEGIRYHSVATIPAKVGDGLFLYGYGCINPGGGGGNDGILRTGKSEISSFSNWDFIAKKPGGAALCFGDSGGPGFLEVDGKKWQIGVNSKGNISDTSYLTDLSKHDSLTFLKDFATKHSVEICGINKDCFEPPGPQPITIEIESEILGKFTVELKPDTQEPDKVRTYLGDLIRYLEKDMQDPSGSVKPPPWSDNSEVPHNCP